jgi:hypothetical protein
VIVTTPALLPVTLPVLLIDATPGLLLDHVPPVVVLLSVVLAPTQIANVPVMEAGFGLTVSGELTEQPVGSVYMMQPVKPGPAPVIIPVDDPMVAIAVLQVPHVPPSVPSYARPVPPTQRLDGAVIAAGSALMVAGVVTWQPVDSV